MKRKIPVLDKPRPTHRALLPEESELWHRAMQNPDEKLPTKRTRGVGAKPPTVIADKPVPLTKKTTAATSRTPGDHLEKTLHSRIQKGSTCIEATLDLHGHTLDTAYGILLRFIMRAQENGVRTVLIITGKGRAGAIGALRATLPRWLQESPLRERIIAYDNAGARHGGAGAWYVRIRKQGSKR
jgi:DNA-nicking Smr family endonuclease